MLVSVVAVKLIALQATKEIYENVESKAVGLVDASNTFSSLNCNSALLNMFELCPSFATIPTNIYLMSSSLLIDGTSLLSLEGTMQGDPLVIKHL